MRSLALRVLLVPATSLRTLILCLLLFLASTCFSQDLCFRTCSPDPGSPTYPGSLQSTAKLYNYRGGPRPHPPVRPIAAGAAAVLGSESYSYAVPLVHLPGRAGLDLDLALYYNSAIWNYDQSDNSVTFNADRDSPSYGFRLDYGYLEFDSVSSTYFLFEGDGGKHQLSGANNQYLTTDSTYTTLDPTHANGPTLTYKNGTQIRYAAFPTQPQTGSTFYRPVRITDTNGNFITITYADATADGLQIGQVTDTLGRVVKFNYDANNLLTSLTDGGVTTYATFSWSVYTLTYNFSNTVHDSPANGTSLNVITGVTLRNGTSVSFGYGNWGIVNTITSKSSNGTTRSSQTYNYPSSSTQVTGVPTYTICQIFDGVNTRIWNYAVTKTNGIVSQSTITDPGGTTTVMNMSANGDWMDGLVTSVQVKSGGNPLRTIANSWAADAGTNANPRLGSVVSTLEDSGQQSKVEFTCDSYGNTTLEEDYDYGLELKRQIVSAYNPPAAVIAAHILDRITQVKVEDASGTIFARTDYSYDGSNPQGLNGAAPATYDSTVGNLGNVTSMIRYTHPSDATGPITRNFAYDILGNLVSADLDCCNQKVWSFSSTTQFAYPDSITRGPIGTQLSTSATYNFADGSVATFTNENGKITTYHYDSAGRLHTVQTPDSVIATYAYDDTSAQPSVTLSNSANSAAQVSIFDGLGRTLKSQLLSGSTLLSTTETQYDEPDRQVKSSNPYSPSETPLWTTTTYDYLARISQTAPPSGGQYQYSYAGNTVTTTDPAGKTRKTYNDADGRLIRVDEPGPGANSPGTAGSGSINVSGSLQSSTTSGTQATGYFTVDGADAGTQTWVCNDECVKGPFVWDSGSIWVTVNGCTASTSYGRFSTAAGLASALASALNSACSAYVSASYPGSGATVYLTAAQAGPDYSLTGSASTNDPTDFPGGPSFSQNFSGSTLTGGVNPVTTYDSGAVTVTVNGFQASASYNQSLNTNSTAIAAALYNGLNASGSPVTASLSGTTITMTAKTLGTATNYSVTGSSTTSFTASSTTLAGGTNAGGLYTPVSTIYAYDAPGNLTNVTKGTQTRIFVYDGIGEVTSSTLPESGNTTFTYTDYGAMHTKQDARGVISTYGYDGLHRLASIDYNVGATGVPATASVGFTYGSSAASNNLGRLISMTDGTGSESYTYDASVGRITDVTKVINGNSFHMGYSYNTDGTLQNLTYPSGRIVGQNYDAIGRLASITSVGTSYLTVNTYNSAMLPTGVSYGNGVAGSFGYNDHLQISSIQYASGANSLLNLGYDYGTGNDGTIQKVSDARGDACSTQYTYDALARLTQAQTVSLTPTTACNSTWNLSWTYDSYGNRLSQTLNGGSNISAAQPQLTVDPATNHITNTGLSYDAAGNQIADPNSSYTFDADNRVVSSVTTGVTTNYTYDGHRLRVVKGSTIYIYAGTQVIAEYAVGNTTTPAREYVYSGSKLLATIAGGNSTYHYADHLSNRVEADAAGNITRQFGQLPFGETWYETAADKWKFTNYERDSESGNDYALNRYYSPIYGRFGSADPYLASAELNDPQTLNRYSYAGNDPCLMSDPLGLKSQCTLHVVGMTNLPQATIDEVERIFSAAGIDVDFSANQTIPGAVTLAQDVDLHDVNKGRMGLADGIGSFPGHVDVDNQEIASRSQASAAYSYAVGFGRVLGHELGHILGEGHTGSDYSGPVPKFADSGIMRDSLYVPDNQLFNPNKSNLFNFTRDQAKRVLAKCKSRNGGGGGHGPLSNTLPQNGPGGAGFDSPACGPEDDCDHGRLPVGPPVLVPRESH